MGIKTEEKKSIKDRTTEELWQELFELEEQIDKKGIEKDLLRKLVKESKGVTDPQ